MSRREKYRAGFGWLILLCEAIPVAWSITGHLSQALVDCPLPFHVDKLIFSHRFVHVACASPVDWFGLLMEPQLYHPVLVIL